MNDFKIMPAINRFEFMSSHIALHRAILKTGRPATKEWTWMTGSDSIDQVALRAKDHPTDMA
jgi:hypothetical protein